MKKDHPRLFFDSLLSRYQNMKNGFPQKHFLNILNWTSPWDSSWDKANNYFGKDVAKNAFNNNFTF